MEVPGALYAGFLAFPDAYIAYNLAPINEEVLRQQHDDPEFALDESEDRKEPTDSDTARPSKRPKLNFSCAPCGKSYTEKRSLARHKHTDLHHRHAGLAPLAKVRCAYLSCPKSFTRDSDRRRHEGEAHNGIRRPAPHNDNSHPGSQLDHESGPDFPGVEWKQETFFFEDDASSTWTGWEELAPQMEVMPGPANWKGTTTEQAEPALTSAVCPRRVDDATFTRNVQKLLESPGEQSMSASMTDYRESQSWYRDDSDTEDEHEQNEPMEPRPETQLSQKTTKSSAADSAIDLSDDQPHEPKKPSIRTFDYRSEQPNESSTSSSVDSERAAVPQRPGLPQRPKTSVIQNPGKTTTLPAPAPSLCVFCDVPFSGDEDNLMTHLRQHLDALRGRQPHVCRACNTGFVHKADLDKHENSVKLHAHCGFQFDHLRPCTGHHPPSEVVPDVLFTDRDSFRLCEQLRQWEFWQLRLYIEEIKRLVAKRNCETSTTYSIEALFKKSRESTSSFAISVNTYGSAPCDRAAGGQLDIGGLKHRMKMMSLKSSTMQVRHTARKIPQLLRSSSGHNKTLYNAVTSGDQPQVKVLVQLGADPNAVIGNQSILSAAAQWADVETVKVLIQMGASVHTAERKFGSPLASAAHAGKADICEALIAAGANVLQAGGKYGCPLSAAAASDHITTASLLLDHGADLEQQGGECFCPLSSAAAHGKIDMVRFLLECGANGNHFGGGEGSPLGFAVWNGHAKTARTLINSGVDVDAPSLKHGTILNAAMLKVVKREGAVETVQLMLEAGANVNQHGLHNPLSTAAEHADLEVMPRVVSLLLAYGADPHINGSRSKALQLAKSVRQKWMDRKPFMAVSGSCDEIDDIIGHCYEVIRLLKEAGATDEVRSSVPLDQLMDGLNYAPYKGKGR
ncbi:hypothetical protein B0A55_02545 [Friedmanniomyces simplex]|uniref:C2H2-type domain-containing protein n=1 Tax=Friedmanniomyces simplex TaxID=329884 RepID=A0A4U0XTQ8_9PEZI|nr:hypothetical protein B0A55_02545 [Friedmanniomyces simplex]